MIALSAPAYAEVVRIEVKSRADVLAGKSFGSAGPYEKLSGTIYFAVDPRNSANQIITDIDKAPTNAAGKVEFSSDFYLIKPKDATKGNGTLLYEVSNRGGKSMLGFFNRGSGSLDPQTEAEFGDGFLLQQGFTLLWVGWQFDPPMKTGLVRVYPPIAREPDGRSIQGLVRSNFVPHREDARKRRWRTAITWLTKFQPRRCRERAHRPRLGRGRTAHDSSRPMAVHRGPRRHSMTAGFEPKKIYEVVYRSQDPPVVGVGLGRRSRRDLELKYDATNELERAERRDRPRHRLRDLAERSIPPHVSVLRVQRGRVTSEGARRRHAARGRRRPRQLQSSLRPAVARWRIRI